MAQESGFFNAKEVEGTMDRIYDAQQFADYFALFIDDGVFINPANQLQVVQKTGLTVTVKAGWAYIEGYWYHLTEDSPITIGANATEQEIQTVIGVRLDKVNRKVAIFKRDAATSILPVNNGTIHELILASISLGVGVSSVTDSMITDRRPDKTYCGYVKGVLEQIDTTNIFAQFTDAFNSWFEEVKGQLDEDAAGNLQNQINEMKQNMTTIRSGTSEPDNGVGKDGDVYIKVIDEE